MKKTIVKNTFVGRAERFVKISIRENKVVYSTSVPLLDLVYLSHIVCIGVTITLAKKIIYHMQFCAPLIESDYMGGRSKF